MVGLRGEMLPQRWPIQLSASTLPDTDDILPPYNEWLAA